MDTVGGMHVARALTSALHIQSANERSRFSLWHSYWPTERTGLLRAHSRLRGIGPVRMHRGPLAKTGESPT